MVIYDVSYFVYALLKVLIQTVLHLTISLPTVKRYETHVKHSFINIFKIRW